MPKTSGKGRIITRFGAKMLMATENQEIHRSTARRKLDTLACGDYVEWQQDRTHEYRITKQLPRKNALTRTNMSGKTRAIAANIDQILIVIAWQPRPQWDMLDRYLVTAEQLNTQACILLNKNDLASDSQQIHDDVIIRLAEYEQINYPVLTLSCYQQKGLNSLAQQLQNKTSILLGQSGVGKSSIVQHILPEEKIRVGEISDNGEGKHTTTSTTLYKLFPEQENNHSYLVDSPGVRNFQLPIINTTQLASSYREFYTFSHKCRFHNCLHHHEPGCAVKQAKKENLIFSSRYQRYINHLKSLQNKS